MNKRRVQHFTATMLSLGLAAGLTATASAQPNPASPSLAEQEKEGCVRNLKAIYTAIQAYQDDHKTLPNWLSDLVPQYLPDTNVLVCPVCRRTGQTEKPPLGDPNFPSSYLFEFCQAPLGREAPSAPTRTRREWKRLQMGDGWFCRSYRPLPSAQTRPERGFRRQDLREPQHVGGIAYEPP